MAKQESRHLFLVQAENFFLASQKVKHFLERYELVRYDSFFIEKTHFRADTDTFWLEIERGLIENQKVLKGYLEDLKKEGFTNFSDLLNLPQGYLSKIVHLIAHLLDGFFGIDSYFYNLVEDSHWISPSLKRNIEKTPDNYFLVQVTAQMEEPLYKFETLSPRSFFKM
ncbi:hypothetical protein THC_1586 [Caldimicrobium thiodismutans]|jgi:hypothetical protein|uniref:Uncharacterized protein n=1 Tax=Caldimicrobium thiodismutans TaxID=1653476 RepID=A0A0U5AZ31_9BACT|nr:hypothetical protein [Caldimicrobium thiodismutans]BAU23950.1 hypothetical protein THC_1586 [Caldimicrobium thiodismutans]